MMKSWLKTVGSLSLGYSVFLAFFAINALGSFTFYRHEKTPPVRPSEWAYLMVTFVAAIALASVGVLIHRRDTAVSSVQRSLALCGSVLLVKAVVVGWMVSSFFRNPTGPMDGLVGALIPLSILPSVLWAGIQFSSAWQLGTHVDSDIARIRDLDVNISVPAELVPQVKALITQQRNPDA